MPGTAGSGNWSSDVQRSNAQNPRGARRDTGRERSNKAMGGQHAVAGEPVATAGFTWERATKIQCVHGDKMTLPEHCAERTYFTKHAAHALRSAAACLPVPALLLQRMCDAVPKTLDAATLETVLHVESIEYGQLCVVKDPDLTQREPPANDVSYVPAEHFENYTGQNHGKSNYRVQAPVSEGGAHYEVLNQRAFHWRVKITCTVHLGASFTEDKSGLDVEAGSIKYAVLLHLAKRGRGHLYCDEHKENDQVCLLSFGHLNESTNGFVVWDNPVAIGEKDLREKLFYQFNRSGAHWPAWEEHAEDDPLEDRVQVRTGPRQRFILVAQDGQMAYQCVEKGSTEPEWVSLCNFELLRLNALYQFVEDDCGDPFMSIICRLHLDPAGEGIVTVLAEDEVRDPDLNGKRFLDVEVLVQHGNLRSNADVKKLFSKYHVNLNTTVLTPDMLSCWICEQPLPGVTSCIVRFGRQKGEYFASGNLAWNGEVLLTLEKAKIAIVPQYFKDSILPVPKQDYPRHVIIPQCHVRFVIFVNFWTNLVPHFFLNNTLVAKAVFAQFVMGLYSTKIWGGQTGFGVSCYLEF